MKPITKTQITLFSLILILIVSVNINAQVVEEWYRTYDRHSGNQFESALKIAVDNLGNIITGGNTYSETTGRDMTIIKYNPAGDTLWVRIYNGPDNLTDGLRDMAIDDDGNIYVTGESYNATTTYDYDYVTLKYAPNGTLLWQKRFDGLANYSDLPTGIAIDNLGNVYVTGSSSLNSTPPYDHEVVTIKYNSLGDTLWLRRFDLGLGQDGGTDIAVDEDGNVFISMNGYNEGSTEVYFMILKYDANGILQWNKEINTFGFGRTSHVAVDNENNAIITGSGKYDSTSSSRSYITAKYDQSGNELWIKRYFQQGTFPSHFGPSDLKIDSLNNIYICGRKRDENNNIVLLTLKYNSAGFQVFAASYSGPFPSSSTGDQEATSLVLDNLGNVYVTGYIRKEISDFDIVTIKYNQFADSVWVKLWTSPFINRSIDQARAIAYYNGNVYLAGYTNNSDATGYQMLTIKYVQIITNVKDLLNIPTKYILFQNYPNPFNPTTTIKYALPFTSNVQIIIYNILGETINELVNNVMEAGYYEVNWSAENSASGIYFYKVTTKSMDGKNNFNSIKKMVLVK